MMQIKLSPSKLNIFNECPRCFWDAYAAKCPKPRGIFPSLPGGMDRILKMHFDQFRDSIPRSMMGKNISGKLFDDMTKLKAWRNWRTGLSYVDPVRNIQLIGALDDCVVDGEFYIPLDYKTKGSQPKDDGVQYYQTQLDCYNLMLFGQGYKTRDEGYLVYFFPTTADICLEIANSIEVTFGVEIYKIQCSIERAKELIVKAAECLRGKRPQSALSCEHCNYLRMEDDLTKRVAE